VFYDEAKKLSMNEYVEASNIRIYQIKLSSIYWKRRCKFIKKLQCIGNTQF